MTRRRDFRAKHHGYRFAACAAAILCSLFAAGGAASHESDFSYLRIDLDGEGLIAEWEVARSDARLLVGLDAGEPNEDSWAELRIRAGALLVVLAENLSLRAGGAACPIVFATPDFERAGDRDYLLTRFRAACGVPIVDLEVAYSLLFAEDAKHRAFVVVDAAGRLQSAILSRESTSARFDVLSTTFGSSFRSMLREGVSHIAAGYDHILFLMTLLLAAPLVRRGGKWSRRAGMRATAIHALEVVTAFTVAHSVTLALVVFDWIWLPDRWVESAIALSVLLAAANNLAPFVPGRAWTFALVTGLVHGMGFARVLQGGGFGPLSRGGALLGFNLGVEIGQVAIVLLALPVLQLAARSRHYERAVLGGGSWMASWIATVWLVERALDIDLVSWL